MKLLISVHHPNITTQLRHQGKAVDAITWQDTNDLSRSLLVNIDKLLQRNKIKIQELAGVEVETGQAAYTSARIARAVANTVVYCLTHEKKSV